MMEVTVPDHTMLHFTVISFPGVNRNSIHLDDTLRSFINSQCDALFLMIVHGRLKCRRHTISGLKVELLSEAT